MCIACHRLVRPLGVVSRGVSRSLEERRVEMSHQLEAARAATRGDSLTAEVSTEVHTPAFIKVESRAGLEFPAACCVLTAAGVF